MANLNDYMKVGIVHFMAFPETLRGSGPILETVKRVICDDYFDAIEMTWINDGEVRTKVANLLQHSKIEVCYGAQPRLLTTGLNINDLNDSKRAEALDTLKRAVDEAKEIGAKGIAFLSGKYEEATKEESYNALVHSTKALCQYAKEREMNVVLEIFDYDIDKKSLIGPTLLAKRFADEIAGEHYNFGLMVDLSHIPMYYESIKESLEPIKEHLVHIHVGNTVIKSSALEAYGDTHPRFGFNGGENDVNEVYVFLRSLFEVGYLKYGKRPIISFEVKPWKDEDVEVVLINAKRTLNEAWRKLKMNDKKLLEGEL